MNSKLESNHEEPRENPLGTLKILVFCVALAVMIIITAWPHTFGSTTSTMNHNAAMLSMIGMCIGFIYGIGFVPKQRWLKPVYTAPVALGLMLAGFVMMLF